MPRRPDPKPFRLTIVRWVGKDGRRCPPKTPGARKVKSKSETYYARLPGQKVATSLKTTDIGLAWQRLREAMREAKEQSLGISDPYLVQSARPLTEHLEEWAANLLAKGTSAQQVSTSKNNVIRLAGMAGWKMLPHITGETALNALGRLQKEGVGHGKIDGQLRVGRSAQTRNHYLTQLKGFCRWCHDEGRLRRNPVAHIQKINIEVDRRHERRSPSEEDISSLFAYLHGPDAVARRGMTGPQRALGYRLCMATGFRASELRSLSLDSFRLEQDPPTVTVQAAFDKRRRKAVVTIPAWLASELRTWFAEGGGLWQRLPRKSPGILLKKDLEAADVPFEIPGPDGPLFFDMHSLRHWYCTQVASQPGMDLRTLLTLTRHSTAELAIKRYAHQEQGKLIDAVGRLPNLSQTPPKEDTTK